MRKPRLGVPRPNSTHSRFQIFRLIPGDQKFVLVGHHVDVVLHWQAEKNRSVLCGEPECPHCEQDNPGSWRRFIYAIRTNRFGRAEAGVLPLTATIVTDIGGETPQGMAIEIRRPQKKAEAHGFVLSIEEECRWQPQPVLPTVLAFYGYAVPDTNPEDPQS